MEEQNSIRTNLKKGINSWLNRQLIHPCVEESGAKVYTGKNVSRLILKSITYGLIMIAIFLCFLRVGLHIYMNWEWKEYFQLETPTKVESKSQSEKKQTNKLVTTTTAINTETVTTDTEGKMKTENVLKKETVTKPEPEKKSESPKTLTEFIMKAFEKKSVYRIVFDHLLFICVVFIIYQTFLVIMGDLKRFKMGSLEIEAETSGAAVLQTINQMTTKFDLLVFWLQDSNLKDLDSYLNGKATIKEYIEVMLDRMRTDYSEEWGIYFEYTVFLKEQIKKKKYPLHVRRAIQILDEDSRAFAFNKDITADVTEKNYLLYKVNVEETDVVGEVRSVEYVIVISSHKHQFDENDVQVLMGYCSLIHLVYERNYIAADLLLSEETINDLQEKIDSMHSLEDLEANV